MQTLDIREKLHQYVDDVFTGEDVKIFDERRAKRLNGESNTYNWPEAKRIIIEKKPI